VYKVTHGKDRDTEVKRPSPRMRHKEGYYRLGKPATTKEATRSKWPAQPIFQKATAKIRLWVNIDTADADDKDKGIKRGDVIRSS